MSENRYFSHKGGRGEGATQNCEHLKSMTADELTEKLAEVWDGMDETDYDPTLIDAYLDALEENAPIATDFDAEAALSDFKIKHARLLKERQPIKFCVNSLSPGQNKSCKNGYTMWNKGLETRLGDSFSGRRRRYARLGVNAGGDSRRQ